MACVLLTHSVHARAHERARGRVLVRAHAPVGERRLAQARQEGAAPLVLDVRRATEYAAGNIAGAMNIAHTRLLGKLAEVPQDRELLVHCQAGLRSARACALLERHGYTVTNMGGGFGTYSKHKMTAQPTCA